MLISSFVAALERIVDGTHPLELIKYAAGQVLDERRLNHMDVYAAISNAIINTINEIVEVADNILTVKDELEEISTSEHTMRILSPTIGIDMPIIMQPNNNDYDNDGLGEAAMA